MRGNFGWAVLYALVIALAVADVALAIERDFSVITNQSSIAVSGTVTTSFGTVPIQPQATGSLTTTYGGTIKTDREYGTVGFLSGSAVAANVNGNWKPDSTAADVAAPADYGGKIAYTLGPIVLESANFAGRNFVAGVTSNPLSLDAAGNFDLSAATVAFASGDLAYRDSSGSLIGATSIANKSAFLSGTGTLSSTIQSGQTTEKLTIPISSTFTLTPNTTTTINLTLTGQLVATTTFPYLAGDYNQNGIVDAADYVLWRDNLGGSLALPNDDTAGVGNDDYNRWRSNFRHTLVGAGALTSAVVPEASTMLLALMAALCGISGRYCRAEI